jgi:hypothetical protein
MSGLLGSSCVICVKMRLLFDGMQKHVWLEEMLRKLSFGRVAPDVEVRHTCGCGLASVRLAGGQGFAYGEAQTVISWAIGGFMLHPDPACLAAPRRVAEGDSQTIMALCCLWMGERLCSAGLSAAKAWPVLSCGCRNDTRLTEFCLA